MPFYSRPYLASHDVTIPSIGYHPETQDELCIPDIDRFSGTYVLGVQGSGKSGLLQNMIRLDMFSGRSVIVIDNHGDLIQHCLSVIPYDLRDKTYLLDMADEGYPFGVNMFSTGKLQSSVAESQAVERLMHIFEVLWPEVLSQQNLPRYVRAAAITLLTNPGATLVDMYTFLQDPTYRARLLANVADMSVRQFWHTQYDNLSPHEQYRRVQPLIGRLEALFMGRSLVRNIVGQRQNSIRFRKSIEEGQIILIRLPVKLLAQDARLIGTLLLAQIHAAVFSYADVPEAKRPGVSLYVDEFQHFATSDFAELLTEGRKFGVRVTVAHQYRNQLPAFLQASTMTARTKICFQLTPEDGREMAHVFPSQEATVKPEDIEQQPVSYLLHHPSNDATVRFFTDTYLHPLHGAKRRGGRIDVDSYRYDYYHGRELPSRQVIDPTVRLNNLLYETMQGGNPNLPIPPEVVEGFSTVGQGFYGAARGLQYNDALLHYDYPFPAHLVRGDRWLRKPEHGGENMLHFVFCLRLLMRRLAENPIGKRTTASTADVARMLTQLPKRAAFVHSGDTVGVIYTHDTPILLPPVQLFERAKAILEHTRQVYCHPKAEVERLFMLPAQASASVQPVSRWEEIE